MLGNSSTPSAASIPGVSSGYSFETSQPAHDSNASEKMAQKKKILEAMHELGGKATIKHLQQKFNSLPASTISGRINDLIDDREVIDTGIKIKYEGCTRKVFALIPQPKGTVEKGVQKTLFNYKKINL